MTASIKFGDYAFELHGTPRYGMQTMFEGAENGVARVQKLTYSIKQEFFESAFSENEAKIAQLRLALDAGEGLLTILDERGTLILSDRVRVKSSDLPQQWRQYVGEVNIVLEGTKQISSTISQATFTPTGATAIILPNIDDWREGVRTERYSIETANRREVMHTITAHGEFVPDSQLTPTDRQAAIIAKRQELEGLKAKDGKLLFAGEERTVRVETLECDAGDTTDRLKWAMTAFYRIFPGDSFSQAEFTVTVREDSEGGKIITSLKGKARASTEAGAASKIAAIASHYAASSGLLLTKDSTTSRIDGPDGAAWLETTFSFDYEQSTSSLFWNLKIRTRQDARTTDLITTYDGTVKGKNASEALTKARALGAGKQSFILSSDEQVATRSAEGKSEQFVEVTFSYEYLDKVGTWQFAEVRSEVTYDPLGDARQIISGYASAATEASAKNLAYLFKSGGAVLRDYREATTTQTMVGAGSGSKLERFDFSYSYYLSHAQSSASYTIRKTENLESKETIVQINGTAYGVSEATCGNFVNSLVSVSGGTLITRETSPAYESVNGATQFLSLAFSATYRSVASGGDSVIEAEVKVETRRSISKAVVTPIPFGVPHLQVDTGTTPGYRIVSGYCLARDSGTASGWAEGQRAKLGGGIPDEDVTSITEHRKGSSSTDSTEYRAEFQYTNVFQNL